MIPLVRLEVCLYSLLNLINRALQEAQETFGVDFDYEDFTKYDEEYDEEDEEEEDEYVEDEEDTERRYLILILSSV